MRKVLFFTFCFFCVFTSSGQHRSAVFNPFWRVGVNVGTNIYLSEGNDFVSPNQQCYFSIGQNASNLGRISVDYAFAPAISVRGMMGVVQHCWSDPRITTPDGGYKTLSFNALNLGADLMVNLSNWLAGYNPIRTVDLSFFGGVGTYYREKGPFSSSLVSVLLRSGLQTDFRVHPQWNLNLMLDANIVPDTYNDYKSGIPFELYGALSVGASYRFKPKSKKTIPSGNVQPALQTSISKSYVPSKHSRSNHSTILVYRDGIKRNKKQDEKYAKKVMNANSDTVKVSVFDNTNDSVFWADRILFDSENAVISTFTQERTLFKIAEYLKLVPEAKVTICGYADRNTEQLNDFMLLFLQRSSNVANTLINNYAIDSNRISLHWFGEKSQPAILADVNRAVFVELGY